MNADIADLQGGKDTGESAYIMRAILAGETGPRRDMVLLNGGAALMAAGLTSDLAGGVALAAECIDSGKALQKLDELVFFTNDVNS